LQIFERLRGFFLARIQLGLQIGCDQIHGEGLLPSFEILDGSFVFFRRGARIKSPEVFSLACFRILFARIKTVFA